MPATIIAKKVRLSFDKNLITPSEATAKKPGKRGCNLISQTDSSFFNFVEGKRIPVKPEELDAVIRKVMADKFGGKVPAKFENWAVRKNVDSVSQQDGSRFTGYEDDNGFYFAPTRYADQGYPAFVRRDGSQIDMTKEDGVAEAKRLFYAGCYVTAKFNIAAFETKEDNVTKRGVTTFLEGIQFLQDGERFGRGEANSEGFEAEEPLESDDEDI